MRYSLPAGEAFPSKSGAPTPSGRTLVWPEKRQLPPARDFHSFRCYALTKISVLSVIVGKSPLQVAIKTRRARITSRRQRRHDSLRSFARSISFHFVCQDSPRSIHMCCTLAFPNAANSSETPCARNHAKLNRTWWIVDYSQMRNVYTHMIQ